MAERRRKKPCLLLAALSQRVCQLSGMFWQIPLKAEPKAGERAGRYSPAVCETGAAAACHKLLFEEHVFLYL